MDAGAPLVVGWLLGYRSANTRAAYARDLTTWLTWITERGVDPLEAKRTHLDAWARSLEHNGKRPTTVARSLSAVASFYKYLLAEQVIDTTPAAHLRRPPTGEGHVELAPALDRSELAAVLQVATAPRDRALVLCLSVLGLRVSELLGLTFDGIEIVRGHTTTLVHGKGGRIDRIPLPPVLTAALHELADHEGRSSGPIFLAADGTPLSRHGVTRSLTRLGRAAGLTRTLRPHMMRATAITSALDAGATLRDVQDFARHADPRTTRRYDRARGALDRHAAYTIATWIPTSAHEEGVGISPLAGRWL